MLRAILTRAGILVHAGRAFKENNACSHQSCYTAVHHNPLRFHAPSTQSIIPELGGLKALSRIPL